MAWANMIKISLENSVGGVDGQDHAFCFDRIPETIDGFPIQQHL